ncbi:hypothetical protein BP5796_03844 [Coleophoma crateriformis]|uniref:Aminotransferase class I/classII large domain-containing protein n=1 Tax=Coleophoma crateriformis TaxID=565419 RepID=A0A3D8SGN7_9HELO|nr:hypothetical protein BP5796_03844 [Coleophoma crateriformis]
MGSVQESPMPDLSHHLNAHSRARHESPLKAIIKYMAVDGMISVAGGLPHSSLFPFESVSLNSYPASAVLDAENPKVPGDLDTWTIAKHPTSEQPLNLATSLQYGDGRGEAGLLKWAREFTKLVFQPAYEDFDILVNSGNTDAWSKVVGLLCEAGDSIICEEYSYPSAQSNWIPLGCFAAPVKMDEDGMRADALEKTLADWGINHPDQRRPRLMYLVPVGSNPAGTTMRAQRRKDIYDICVKYDVIICEDDPYCFLQYGDYEVEATTTGGQPGTPEQFLSSLVPSFLKFDYQGRVIRLDTFSKTLAPGNRLGYFVANKLFTQKLLEATQVETQAPSGWSQAIVFGLLSKWGIMGYVQWLSSLRDQYRIRRDWMCDAIASKFDVKPASSLDIPGAEGLVALAKGTSTPIFSFVPPTGGMFIWTRFYLNTFPAFQKLRADESCKDPELACEDALWVDLCEAKVLLIPGYYYIPWEGPTKATTKSRGGEAGIGHFRLAFSMSSKEEMNEALSRMATVVDAFLKK